MKKILIIFLLFPSLFSFSQAPSSTFNPNDSAFTYQQMILEYDSFYANDTSIEEGANKHYERFKWFWDCRIGSDQNPFLSSNKALSVQYNKKDLACSQDEKNGI
jgi:hypothetical protein